MEEEQIREPTHLVRLTETDLVRVALMAEGLGYKEGDYDVGVTDENGAPEFFIIPKNIPRAS